ncbi:MAG: glutathione S-transferase family protein [Hyphomicrobiaceae bacterium]|nr:glutathione S-transferase family protein [Hyphomicrobiaceae bacterium]
MITLFIFGPAFGLPDPSPFVTKAEVLLKMSGLPYQTKRADVRKAPKGKLPFIKDESGAVIADSTLIRFYLEHNRNVDFDKGLSPADRGAAWMIEKFCEDHIYWIVMRERWQIRENFEKGPKHFFDPLPAPLRPLVISMVNRQFRRNLWGQGLGRHSATELDEIAARGINGLADFLGDKDYLMGAAPCGADATVWSAVFGILCPHFESATRAVTEQHPNLVAYAERGRSLWYPHIAPFA